MASGQASTPAGISLDTVVFGNPLGAWLIAAAVGLAAFVGVLLLRRVVLGRVRRIADRKRDGLFGLLPRLVLETSPLVAVAIALYAASLWLVLGDRPGRLVGYIVVLVAAVQVVLWGRLLVGFAIDEFLKRRAYTGGQEHPDGAVLASAGILRILAMTALYAGVVLLVVENLGYDVTALIAGLGIGGIAVALAAQNILSDLFGSLSIVLDKPFVVGDFIIVGEQLGTVEKIGIKTTRVRSLSGEQLVFANSDLLSSRIRNYKRMAERRVVFGVRVRMGTPAEKLELAQQILADAVRRTDLTRLDRAHFAAFGAFSLDFEVVYYVHSRDYGVYMDCQQAINLHIYRRFAEEGIELALPTQILHVAEGPERVTTPHAAAAGRGAGENGDQHPPVHAN